MPQDNLAVVIPSRLGSNRVKCKNLRLLNGRPLIEYIIETLKKTKHLTNIYINSESDYFKTIAERNGIKFYKRCPDLATSTSMIDEYLYDFICSENPDYLAVVNPTSPFADEEQLDKAWKQFKGTDCDTLLSATRIQTHCFYKGIAINYSTDGLHPRSQDLEPVLALNFMITIWDCKKFRAQYEEKGHGVYTGKLGFFVTEGNANIDVDYEEDFAFAEFVGRFLASNPEPIEAQYDEVISELITSGVDTRT